MILAEPDKQEIRAKNIRRNLQTYASAHFNKWWEVQNPVSCDEFSGQLYRDTFNLCTNMRELPYSIFEDLTRLGYKIESVRSSELEDYTLIIRIDASEASDSGQ